MRLMLVLLLLFLLRRVIRFSFQQKITTCTLLRDLDLDITLIYVHGVFPLLFVML